jgi:hypothetical protein
MPEPPYTYKHLQQAACLFVKRYLNLGTSPPRHFLFNFQQHKLGNKHSKFADIESIPANEE